jgi:hypothetical protein
MSLVIHVDGSATLSKYRIDLCLGAVGELEALAYALPTITTNGDPEALASGFVVRGFASRFLSLAHVLMAAIDDDAATSEELQRTVSVTQLGGRNGGA